MIIHVRRYTDVKSSCVLPTAVCSIVRALLQLLLGGLHRVGCHILLSAYEVSEDNRSIAKPRMMYA